MEAKTHTVRRRGRPSRFSGGSEETKARLIQAGVETLTEKGFSSTGIDEVLRRVGVPKGSFYHYFDSKEDFGGALITHYGDYFSLKLARHLEDPSLPPLERLRAFISDAQAGMAKYDYRRGCLIGNLGQEMGALPESYRAHLSRVFGDWQGRVASCFAEAQAIGDISPSVDCTQLAAYFWIGWEGAVLRAKLARNPEALNIFTDVFFSGLAHR